MYVYIYKILMMIKINKIIINNNAKTLFPNPCFYFLMLIL